MEWRRWSDERMELRPSHSLRGKRDVGVHLLIECRAHISRQHCDDLTAPLQAFLETQARLTELSLYRPKLLPIPIQLLPTHRANCPTPSKLSFIDRDLSSNRSTTARVDSIFSEEDRAALEGESKCSSAMP